MKKRITSFIIIAALSLNLFLSAGFTAGTPVYGTGYTVLDLSVGAPVSKSTLKGESSFPEYYSSKDLGYTSGVDNQQSSDTCWAFTHNELIEINLAKKYGIKYDFSEQAMKFETSNITNPLYGYMRNPNGAGNEFFSTAYLARTGSVLERDEPFSLSEERTAKENSLARFGRLVSVPMYEFGVNYTNIYNSDAINTIKSLVMKYGAAGSSLFYDQGNTYQQPERINYYYNGIESTANHAVTIVGWDDNYSASNFKKTPAGNGAFIVKNSWGLYHNNNTSDYVYVSYYDKHITNQIFATEYEIENNLYDNIYQYDPLGMSRMLAVQQSSAVFVTRFVADRADETVTAVSTYITQPDLSLKIMISTSGDFRNRDNYKTVYEGTFDTSGYYVLPITPTKLSGNEYYIAVELNSQYGYAPFAIQSNERRLIDNSICIPNTCYIGGSFSELATLEAVCDAFNNQTVLPSEKINNPMLCIKAFTSSSDSQNFYNIGAYTDVQDYRWYAKAVDYAVGAGLFAGVSSTEFEPSTQMTRAMFVKVLANLTNVDLSGYTGVSFDDIEKNRWYAAAVEWAAKNDIVNGMTENKFMPYENVTRQQMCVMLMRYAKYIGLAFEEATDGFVFADDNMIQDYARTAVYTCRKYGIINGMTDITFEPRSFAQRSQVANMFMNFCQKYIY